jgi:hypothetical protein
MLPTVADELRRTGSHKPSVVCVLLASILLPPFWLIRGIAGEITPWSAYGLAIAIMLREQIDYHICPQVPRTSGGSGFLTI